MAISLKSISQSTAIKAPRIVLLGVEKIGKEQPVSEPILGEFGWIKMGDIRKGMNVFGRDGKPTTVIGVYSQGVKDVYEVSFSDGTCTRCGL